MATNTIKLMMRAITNGLEIEIREMSDGLFRFDVCPASEQTEPTVASGRVAFDASDGSVVLSNGDGQSWRGKITKLAKFGRAGVPGLELSWRAWDGEAIYGLGQRFNGFNQAGRIVHMWIEDVPGQQGDNAPSYYATPVLYSTRGYALFAADNPEGVFDLNSMGDGLNRYRRAGQTMTFYVAFGQSLRDLVMRREAVQGPHRSIPDWAWGPWISRNSYENQAEAEAAIRGMIERRLPVAAIVQEAWKGPSRSGDFNNFDTARWTNLPGYFALCHRHNIKTILWQVPVIHPSSPEFARGEQNGYFVKKPDGSVSFRLHWMEGFANVDFTNPDAVKYWQDLIRPTLRLGVWGFKADDGEDIKPDDVFSDGRRGWELHNEYSTLYNRALTELMEQEGVDGLLWARSGSLGNERYPALWAGDQYARWNQMASLLPAGLSAGMSGMPFWGHDIGGYMEQPSPELYIRWTQFGALSPLMQYHGILPREPWEFGAEAEAAYALMARLRMNLVPTLIELGREAAQTGIPIMRPMLMEFPNDERFVSEDTQYMLGPDLLVAPVLEEGATGRRIKFPRGVWQHALRPVSYEGPCEADVPVGLVDAPLFVREGARLKLQMRKGATFGEWDETDPVGEVEFGPDRAVIHNPTVPLVGNVLQRRTVLTFELREPGPTDLRAYWLLEGESNAPTAANVKREGNRVEVDLTPPNHAHLTGLTQKYFVEDDRGRVLFSGGIRWKSPVTLELDRSRIPIAFSGSRLVDLGVVNRSAEPLSVRVEAPTSVGVLTKEPVRTVDVPAHGETCVRWKVLVAETNALGDVRVRFIAKANELELDNQTQILARSPRWVVVGPFRAAPKTAYARMFAPEWNTSPNAFFQVGAEKVRWRAVPREHLERFDGLDFNELFGRAENAAAYALTRIRAERDMPVELRFGSDDTLTVWLNGDKVYSVETYRLAAPDQEVVKAMLRGGVNTLLVKVAQDKNPWRLLFRITAPDGQPVHGLTDGFDDYAAYMAPSGKTEIVSAALIPFDWKVLGPVPGVPEARAGWVLPTDRMAKTPDWPPPGSTLSWRRIDPADATDNLVDFARLFGKGYSDVVAYATTTIHADRPLRVRGVCGSDDGIVVWINGEQVHATHGPRGFKAGEDSFETVLRPGANRVLCRISQGDGEWKFQLNFFDMAMHPPRPLMGEPGK